MSIVNLQQLAAALKDRQMTAPTLLFLSGHRPLAFTAGQLIYLAAPLADLLGDGRWREWAALLSDPDALVSLENALDENLDRND
jgi:hypothetical protein